MTKVGVLSPVLYISAAYIQTRKIIQCHVMVAFFGFTTALAVSIQRKVDSLIVLLQASVHQASPTYSSGWSVNKTDWVIDMNMNKDVMFCIMK